MMKHPAKPITGFAGKKKVYRIWSKSAERFWLNGD
jgi:hypothetical protein